jgi:hypothetical protein
MRVLAALLLCLCVLTPGALFGQGYVEGYFGSSSLESSGVDVLDNESAFGFWGGYAVSSNFSFEAGYANLGDFGASEGPLSASIEFTSLNFGIKGLVPLEGGAFIQGKVGMAFWDATATISDGFDTLAATVDGEDLYLGFGASYMFSDTSYATVDYLMVDFDGNVDVSVVSFGIGMLF